MAAGDAVRDPAQWSVQEVGGAAYPQTGSVRQLLNDLKLPRMQIVHRLDSDGAWEPWLLEAESAALRKAGVCAYGLYALQPLKGPRAPPPRALSSRRSSGTRIGTYGGRVLGMFADIEASEAQNVIEEWAMQRDSLLAMIVRPGEHTSIVDGSDGPPPLLHRVNDARGLDGARNNVRFNPQGIFYALRDVPPAAWRSATRLADLAPSELLVSYGRGHYWRIHAPRLARAHPRLDVPSRPRCESPVPSASEAAVPVLTGKRARESAVRRQG